MVLEYNLQFFAKDGPGGEKTEEPTAKKLEDARKEGQVAKSKEIGNAFGLLAMFILLKVYVGSLGGNMVDCFSGIYNQIPDAITMYGGKIPVAALFVLLHTVILKMLLMLAPVFLIGVVVAVVCDVVQVKWKPTSKPLQPKFSKLNPISGFKRIFSANALIELLKSIAKIGIICYVVYSYMKDKIAGVFLLYDMSLNQAISLVGETAIDVGIRISAVYMVIAFLDYAYQKHKFKEDMKMTKQEVKDEYKNTEGNPEIKGRQRQRMQEASRRRMMQDVPKADVIITNPTHLSVALKYDPNESKAPVVLAKGEDHLALKIREVAKENHIEIVENKPLARMLYANVDIGQEIPPELYQAVAEVLALVYDMKNT